jgi:hypothetical protein
MHISMSVQIVAICVTSLETREGTLMQRDVRLRPRENTANDDHGTFVGAAPPLSYFARLRKLGR